MNGHRMKWLLGLVMVLLSCKQPTQSTEGLDFRGEMRSFIQGMSAHARTQDADFIVILQNGHEILTSDGTGSGIPQRSLIEAIDGVARESLNFGYPGRNDPTPRKVRGQMLAMAQVAAREGLSVLIVDYCSKVERVDASLATNDGLGFVTFGAHHRELDAIPPYPLQPPHVHGEDVSQLGAARNFLYLINPDQFESVGDLVSTLKATDYDLLILDGFFDKQLLQRDDIESLKKKANGASRLVVAYMSIGEAEDYRYYFRPEWLVESPGWLAAENPDWKGNYKVRYWEPEWQRVIYGDGEAYLDRLLAAGFDGVYLDIIDAFEYFEER